MAKIKLRGVKKRAAARPDRHEVMLHVYWSCLDVFSRAKDNSHLIQRGKVTADLGLDKIPDPPFTNDEMQAIMFAAKMEAIRMLSLRVKRSRKK